MHHATSLSDTARTFRSALDITDHSLFIDDECSPVRSNFYDESIEEYVLDDDESDKVENIDIQALIAENEKLKREVEELRQKPPPACPHPSKLSCLSTNNALQHIIRIMGSDYPFFPCGSKTKILSGVWKKLTILSFKILVF